MKSIKFEQQKEEFLEIEVECVFNFWTGRPIYYRYINEVREVITEDIYYDILEEQYLSEVN